MSNQEFKVIYPWFFEENEATPVIDDKIRATALLIRETDPYGNLHVIVDDLNVEDDHIAMCRDHNKLSAQEEELMQLFDGMSENDRLCAIGLAEGMLEDLTGRVPFNRWENPSKKAMFSLHDATGITEYEPAKINISFKLKG